VDGAVRKLRGRHVEVRWTMPSFEPALALAPHGVPTVEDVVFDAVRIRIRASQARAERVMRLFGVRARPVDHKRHGLGEGRE
jgi:hypothetical protein